MELNFGIVEGLPDEEQRQLRELKYIYDYHRTTNRKKRRYYNGKITLQEVNLGIALPYGIRRLQIGCSWGAKTVDVLAARSMFDGFVTENGTKSEHMDAIMRRNHLIAEYNKAVKEELKYGCEIWMCICSSIRKGEKCKGSILFTTLRSGFLGCSGRQN